MDPFLLLDHAVGLRMLRRGQAMFYTEVAAQQIEVVLAGGRALAQAVKAISERLAFIRCPAIVCLQTMR